MKKNILKFTAFLSIIGCCFMVSNIGAKAQTIGNATCKGSTGHCMEYQDVTYYGKLYVTKPQHIE